MKYYIGPCFPKQMKQERSLMINCFKALFWAQDPSERDHILFGILILAYSHPDGRLFRYFLFFSFKERPKEMISSKFFVTCPQFYNPLSPSVNLSVRLSIFFSVYGWLLHYCSCPNAWIAFFIMAPAHQHTTKVAVSPALLVGKA